MDAEDFLPYLGKTDETAEIRQLLAALGIAKHPKPKRGELDAYVELPEQGLMLTFERPEEGRTSLLALNDIQFYSEEFGYGFSSFPGKLPRGLLFSDGKEAVRRKLGRPDLANDEMGNDIWEFDGYDLIVEYRREAQAIGVVHLSVSDEE